METKMLLRVLAWCIVINFALLVVWFAGSILTPQSLRTIPASLFRLSESQFEALNYGGFILYKMGFLLFNVVPYIALRIAESRRTAK